MCIRDRFTKWLRSRQDAPLDLKNRGSECVRTRHATHGFLMFAAVPSAADQLYFFVVTGAESDDVGFHSSRKPIFSRSFSPTVSMMCVRCLSRSPVNHGRPFLFSSIHCFAKEPFWISARIFFISFFVSGVMIRLPAT